MTERTPTIDFEAQGLLFLALERHRAAFDETVTTFDLAPADWRRTAELLNAAVDRGVPLTDAEMDRELGRDPLPPDAVS